MGFFQAKEARWKREDHESSLDVTMYYIGLSHPQSMLIAANGIIRNFKPSEFIGLTDSFYNPIIEGRFKNEDLLKDAKFVEEQLKPDRYFEMGAKTIVKRVKALAIDPVILSSDVKVAYVVSREEGKDNFYANVKVRFDENFWGDMAESLRESFTESLVNRLKTRPQEVAKRAREKLPRCFFTSEPEDQKDRLAYVAGLLRGTGEVASGLYVRDGGLRWVGDAGSAKIIDLQTLNAISQGVQYGAESFVDIIGEIGPSIGDVFKNVGDVLGGLGDSDSDNDAAVILLAIAIAVGVGAICYFGGKEIYKVAWDHADEAKIATRISIDSDRIVKKYRKPKIYGK